MGRHNLTLNKAFIKVPRPATEGRGAYWKLEAGAEAQIFRRMARNYNRPKPVSFARQISITVTPPTSTQCLSQYQRDHPSSMGSGVRIPSSPVKGVKGSNLACH